MKKQKRKQLEKRSVASATRRWRQELYPQGKAGKASDYIRFFDEILRKKKDKVLKVVLYGRVSARGQNYRGNLRGQFDYQKKNLKHYKNIIVIAVIKDVASGWREERDGLKLAAEIALDNDAIVLAESTGRYIRSPYYNSHRNPSAQPTNIEFADLIKSFHGVTLATVLHPDTDWKTVRSHQSKRGQSSKGNKGGRPKKNPSGYKKQWRLEKLPYVLRLHKKSINLRDIAKLTGVPKTTAAEWLRKYG